MKLENAALHRFLVWAERHMPKRYKILFSEQALTQYFVSFCRMAELLQKYHFPKSCRFTDEKYWSKIGKGFCGY